MQEEAGSEKFKGVDRRGISAKKVRHVNQYLTPLAAVIVVPGVLVAPLPTLAAVVAGALILLSVTLNYVSIYLLKENARFIGRLRVTINYTVNIFLAWLLYSTWPPVWLLLLLMAIGVAVYQSRRDSFVAGVAIALMLIAVHWNFGEHLLLAWMEVGVKASMIILITLFVNGLMKVRPSA
ncbi:MAG: hypothetical protein V3R94_08905 [Acidobacteriota bacterium]